RYPTCSPPVFVVFREIPLPSLSLVKKPVPCALISFRDSCAMAATVKSSMDATVTNKLRFISLRFPIFTKLSSLRSSCSQAINNTPTARFCAIGALTVCLDQQGKSMQCSRFKQPKPTARIPFRAAHLSDRDDPVLRTVLPSRLDEDWQESDECQFACRPTSPDPSPRAGEPIRQVRDENNFLSRANPIGTDNVAATRGCFAFSRKGSAKRF